MGLFLERKVHAPELAVVLNSEVKESVSSSDHDDGVVEVAETSLSANVVAQGMLHCLHAHALGLIPLQTYTPWSGSP